MHSRIKLCSPQKQHTGEPKVDFLLCVEKSLAELCPLVDLPIILGDALLKFGVCLGCPQSVPVGTRISPVRIKREPGGVHFPQRF